ncbi:MAG: ribonuclease P [Methanomicrobiales archaeon]|jgi:ribonuclease P protein subunit RPR2|nr:ribonuclease P [Methanomicrobiales archaeon]
MSAKRRTRKEKSNRRSIALERIEILFAQAARFGAFDGGSRDLSHANRCVDLARAIAMKERVRFPSSYRRLFCRNCHCYFIPSVTVQVRVYGGYVIYRCLACGAVRRYPVAHTMQRSRKEIV